MIKEILINDNDLNSIKKSERLKAQLENKGFNLKKTIQIGLFKFKMIYEK